MFQIQKFSLFVVFISNSMLIITQQAFIFGNAPPINIDNFETPPQNWKKKMELPRNLRQQSPFPSDFYENLFPLLDKTNINDALTITWPLLPQKVQPTKKESNAFLPPPSPFKQSHKKSESKWRENKVKPTKEYYDFRMEHSAEDVIFEWPQNKTEFGGNIANKNDTKPDNVKPRDKSNLPNKYFRINATVVDREVMESSNAKDKRIIQNFKLNGAVRMEQRFDILFPEKVRQWDGQTLTKSFPSSNRKRYANGKKQMRKPQSQMRINDATRPRPTYGALTKPPPSQLPYYSIRKRPSNSYRSYYGTPVYRKALTPYFSFATLPNARLLNHKRNNLLYFAI